MDQIILPKNHPNYSELKQVTDNLISFIDADSIYLSAGDTVKERKTIISLFVKKGSTQTSEELCNTTEKLFAAYPQFAYRIFEADWAAYSIRKGNPFFMWHCSIQELVYSIPESSTVLDPTTTNINRLIKKAKRRYKKDAEEISNINRELSLYIRNENHLQAAYILHQTIRRLFYTASWFLAGESIPSMSIAEQQRYIMPFSGLLGSLFDENDLKDALLLQQLDEACESVRNNTAITIIKETIPAATAKAEWLQKEVQRLFDESIRNCNGKFATSNNETNTPSPNRAEANNTNNRNTIATETLDMLLELSSQHFKKLQPDPKIEGVYTAKIKLIGYAELMYLISDLIKVSITAYNDNEENNYNSKEKEGQEDHNEFIINPKVNIANILEMIIQLLPIQEAEYLDILNQVLTETKSR